jgi:hypothetical protein
MVSNAVSAVRQCLYKLAGAVSISLLFQAGTALAASATDHYVDALATGTVHDGKTWATAWWDFSGGTPNQRIDWSQIKDGDTINVNAGKAPPPGYVSSVIYHTPLVVQHSNITIQVPNDPNHDGGMATIETFNNNVAAIDLKTFPVTNVTIQGSKWNPAGVPSLQPNFGALGGGTGLVLGPNASNIILRNLQFQGCQKGLDLLGGTAYCYYLMINNNTNNVVSEPVASSSSNNYYRNPTVGMYYTWIFNSIRPQNLSVGNGIVCRSNPAAAFDFYLSYSIVGPGVNRTVQTNSVRDNFDAYYDLFINAQVSNLEINAPPSHADITYCISFQTPFNQYWQAHSCLGRLTESPNTSVFGTILYGAAVNVTGTQLLGLYNEQFKTSGNTAVVSASQVDPQFASNVSNVSSVAPFTQLEGLDLTPKINTPGSPYCMHSVAELYSKVPH